ncbi:MAG: M3 family oligoendopeptidase, partial [Deltaproteobacteria bacterium]|nr:M3 family oligoendopeptidase [Deltaproteobacteria bacterium]
MFDQLPPDKDELMTWTWADFEPFYVELAAQFLTSENVFGWLKSWTLISQCDNELYNRLYVATTVNTADQITKERFKKYIEDTYIQTMEAEQTLKEKFLKSGLEPEDFEIQLRNMQTETKLFRKENLPLQAKEENLSTKYDEIIGGQTVDWEGEEITLSQLKPIYQDNDRNKREKAWKLAMKRRAED